MTITIVLAGPPKGKGRPRFNRQSGRAYTPAPTVSYEGALRYAAQQTMAGRPILLGQLIVTIVARFPIPASWSKSKAAAALSGAQRPTGKPDFDNLAKTVDALNEVVWKDDAQVVDAHIFKFYSDRPALVVTVREATPAELTALAEQEAARVVAESSLEFLE